MALDTDEQRGFLATGSRALLENLILWGLRKVIELRSGQIQGQNGAIEFDLAVLSLGAVVVGIYPTLAKDIVFEQLRGLWSLGFDCGNRVTGFAVGR